jgi:hypothetical protein
MRDGAPPHVLRNVKQHWTRLSWVNSGQDVEAQSTGLYEPLDIWLWVHLTKLMYSAPINDLCMAATSTESLSGDSSIFDRVRNSVRRRAESCVESHGNRPGHLLYRSDEHRPYLSWDRFLDICSLGLLGSFKWVLYPFRPRVLRHEMSSPTRTLGSCFRIPLRPWIFVYVYTMFVLSCVGSGLASGWSLIQGVLPTV